MTLLLRAWNHLSYSHRRHRRLLLHIIVCVYIIRTFIYTYICTQVTFKDFFNAVCLGTQTYGGDGNQSALSVSVCIARTCRWRQQRSNGIFFRIQGAYTHYIIVLIHIYAYIYYIEKISKRSLRRMKCHYAQ